MKLNDMQKLYEDFFDDNNVVDDPDYDPVHEPNDDPDYTYHIHFIICMYPFIKDNDRNGECAYYFEDPKYKSIIESGFISMKKALDYIFQATSIVTDYSEPKFCSSSERIIKAFPFMDNKQSNEFIMKSNDDQYITLKTSINLSRRKNKFNLIKLFCSFWILQQIYRKLLITIMDAEPYIIIGVYRNNPYKKSNLCRLIPSSMDLTTTGLELINLLNSKDETDE